MKREERVSGQGDRKWATSVALLAAGVAIGSGAALLLAPSNGEELRHTIGRTYRKTAKNIGRHTEDIRDRAEELIDHAHDLRELGSRLLHFGHRGEAA